MNADHQSPSRKRGGRTVNFVLDWDVSNEIEGALARLRVREPELRLTTLLTRLFRWSIPLYRRAGFDYASLVDACAGDTSAVLLDRGDFTVSETDYCFLEALKIDPRLDEFVRDVTVSDAETVEKLLRTWATLRGGEAGAGHKAEE